MEEVEGYGKQDLLPSEIKDKGRDVLERFAGKISFMIEEHKRELERLRKRLREATSESERKQIQKEIEECERDIEELEDILDEIREFLIDLERRIIKSHKTKTNED
jgi:benzoyl-CoA reductase/2-hydroxyglutaryl-CoA dehydratase subunit BcrC/BadD/HgdB